MEKSNSQNTYDQQNTVKITMKLNIKTDADILSLIQSKENKQGYLKELLRNDLDRISSGSDTYVRL